MLAVSSILTAVTLVRLESYESSSLGALPSAALAYELYVPLALAGFGLGSQVPHLWPDGLVVFALHLAWSALLGALTSGIDGFPSFDSIWLYL